MLRNHANDNHAYRADGVEETGVGIAESSTVQTSKENAKAKSGAYDHLWDGARQCARLEDVE